MKNGDDTPRAKPRRFTFVSLEQEICYKYRFSSLFFVVESENL